VLLSGARTHGLEPVRIVSATTLKSPFLHSLSNYISSRVINWLAFGDRLVKLADDLLGYAFLKLVFTEDVGFVEQVESVIQSRLKVACVILNEAVAR